MYQLITSGYTTETVDNEVCEIPFEHIEGKYNTIQEVQRALQDKFLSQIEFLEKNCLDKEFRQIQESDLARIEFLDGTGCIEYSITQ